MSSRSPNSLLQLLACDLYPEYASDVELTEGGGRGSYNGLGIKLTQRLQSGSTTLISYTWSKALDDGSAIRGTRITGQNLGDMYSEDPRCRRCEKGPSAFNTPARVVLSMLHDLPSGKARALSTAAESRTDWWAAGRPAVFSPHRAAVLST